MNLATNNQISSERTRSTPLNDPVVLGVGAFVLGYVIASGRWHWLGQNMSKIAQDMGSMSLRYIVESFQKSNPDLFSKK